MSLEIFSVVNGMGRTVAGELEFEDRFKGKQQERLRQECRGSEAKRDGNGEAEAHKSKETEMPRKTRHLER